MSGRTDGRTQATAVYMLRPTVNTGVSLGRNMSDEAAPSNHTGRAENLYLQLMGWVSCSRLHLAEVVFLQIDPSSSVI